MSLSTYANIRSAILDWTWAQGGLTDTIIKNDIFPQLWAMIYYGDRTNGLQPIEPLRVRSMESSATLTPSAAGVVTISTAVNSGWLEFIEITPTYSYAKPLRIVEPWQFRREQELWNRGTAPTEIATVEGDSLIVSPPTANTLVAAWYQKFTALSADSDTDWIVTNAPHVYLRGGLMLACDYVQDERRAQYRAEFAGAIAALNLNDRTRRASGSPMIARPRVVV